MKSMMEKEIYATKLQAYKMWKGLFKKDFRSWYKLFDNYYIAFGQRCGIEKRGNQILFHDNEEGILKHVKSVSFSTLDEITYYICVSLFDDEEYHGSSKIFIPIIE